MTLRAMPIALGQTGHEAARALLTRMYREYTGKEMPPICTTPLGKPYFEGSSLRFSISHTDRHVFVALSEKNVGIDAEEADRVIDPRLAERILSEGELAQYRAAADKPKALLTFWVLKEARGKLAGTGLQYPANHTCFSLDDPRVTILDGCLVAVMEEEDHAL